LVGGEGAPSVTIRGSTFDGNSATGGLIGAEGSFSNSAGAARGGAIYKDAGGQLGQGLDIVSSTFSGNSATGGEDESSSENHGFAEGGALYVNASSAGIVHLTNVTIAFNSATGGGESSSYGGGIAQGGQSEGSVIQPLNTIIAQNSALGSA